MIGLMTNDGHDSTGDVQRLIASAGDIAGTALGALAGISTANPAFVFAGAVLGSVMGNSVGEIAARTLSGRQERRAGTLVVAAFGELKAKEVLGETVRTDGFFDGEYSDGDEFIEGALRATMVSFEERKLPYLAKLIANVCTDKGVDISTANHTLLVAERLSWMELEVLGIFWAAEAHQKYKLPDAPKYGEDLSNWYEATVHETYVNLIERDRLLTNPEMELAERQHLAPFNLNLSGVVLTNPGRALAGLMELHTIPQTDLAPVFEALTRQPSEAS